MSNSIERTIRMIETGGNTYLRSDDVIAVLREVAALSAPDVRDRLRSLADDFETTTRKGTS